MRRIRPLYFRGQHSRNSFDEQGIAIGRMVQPRDQFGVGRAACINLDQLRYLNFVEASQGHLMSLVDQLTNQLLEPRRGRNLGFAASPK
jgi:hypothetical protein